MRTTGALLFATLLASALDASAALTLLPGSSPQRAAVGQPFPAAVEARVTDAQGNPVAGATVEYADAKYLAVGVTPGCEYESFFAYRCRATTDASGIARFPLLKGRWAGNTKPSLSAYSQNPSGGFTPYGDVALDFTVDPATPPAVLSVVTGNDATPVIGELLPTVRIRLSTPQGNPAGGARIFLFPTTMNTSRRGGFEVPNAVEPWVTTGTDGTAVLPPLRAGWGVGPQSVTVRYRDEGAGADVETPIRYTATNSQGALELALEDLWWGGPTENGWGVSIAQQGEKLFNIYFVYDELGAPTWFTQPEGTWNGGLGDLLTGESYTTRGTPWHDYDATRTVTTRQGLFWLWFMGPEAGRFQTRIDGGNGLKSTSKLIERAAFKHAGGAPPRGVGGLWWGGASQSGWGVGIHEQEGGLFTLWFTYDDAGRPIWYSMPTGTWTDANTYAGTIYRTKSAPWPETLSQDVPEAAPGLRYDARQFAAFEVGTFRLRFEATQRATLEVTLDGRSRSLPLQRFEF